MATSLIIQQIKSSLEQIGVLEKEALGLMRIPKLNPSQISTFRHFLEEMALHSAIIQFSAQDLGDDLDSESQRIVRFIEGLYRPLELEFTLRDQLEQLKEQISSDDFCERFSNLRENVQGNKLLGLRIKNQFLRDLEIIGKKYEEFQNLRRTIPEKLEDMHQSLRTLCLSEECDRGARALMLEAYLQKSQDDGGDLLISIAREVEQKCAQFSGFKDLVNLCSFLKIQEESLCLYEGADPELKKDVKAFIGYKLQKINEKILQQIEEKYKLLDTKDDGNCLYSSFAALINVPLEYKSDPAAFLRKKVICILREKKEKYIDLVSVEFDKELQKRWEMDILLPIGRKEFPHLTDRQLIADKKLIEEVLEKGRAIEHARLQKEWGIEKVSFYEEYLSWIERDKVWAGRVSIQVIADNMRKHGMRLIVLSQPSFGETKKSIEIFNEDNLTSPCIIEYTGSHYMPYAKKKPKDPYQA